MSLSTAARQAIFAQNTKKVVLAVMTIDHNDLASPICIVDNTEDVVSNGVTYHACAFNYQLPIDDDEVPRVQVSVDNVDRLLVEAIRTLTSSPTVEFSIIIASTPDIVEAGPFSFTLKEVQYNALTVQGTLGYEDILDEPFPGDTFTPQNHPALF